MIHRKDLIGPYKTTQNPETYSKPKSYGMKHKKSQTGNLSVAVAREKKLSVEKKGKANKRGKTRKKGGRRKR
jgi:hypothetical protein